MIKAALEYIVGLNKPETVRHGGGVYADKPLYQMKKADFPTLKLNTLESIVRYVQKIGDERQSEDYEAAEPIIIHIESADLRGTEGHCERGGRQEGLHGACHGGGAEVPIW